jgi:hypothetical protein
MPLNVTYRYDEADVVTGCAGSFAKGRLTRVVESKGGLVYCNDPHGNVVTKQETEATVTTTTRYTWAPGERFASVSTTTCVPSVLDRVPFRFGCFHARGGLLGLMLVSRAT